MTERGHEPEPGWFASNLTSVVATMLSANEQLNWTGLTTLPTYTASDCDTFIADYGIISGSICAVAVILGVMFCFFGELINCSLELTLTS